MCLTLCLKLLPAPSEEDPVGSRCPTGWPLALRVSLGGTDSIAFYIDITLTLSPPTGQTPSHGGFANFDAFGSSASSSAFGSIPPAGQAPFPAQPVPPGKLCPSHLPSLSLSLTPAPAVHTHTSPSIHVCGRPKDLDKGTLQKEERSVVQFPSGRRGSVVVFSHKENGYDRSRSRLGCSPGGR